MGMRCEVIVVDEDQINELLANPESIFNLLAVGRTGVFLDKAWHGIHFLLTGSVWGGKEPLCYLVKGGEEIGDVDVGYGPARVFSPNQIAGWADALSAISSDDLQKRYDPEAMTKAGIYPGGWDFAQEDGSLPGELLEFYGELQFFLEQAKSENKGAVIAVR
jgi:hypothetical protein